MTPDQALALRVAERYLTKLVAAERAHALDEHEALISIFAGVDPIELMLTKNTIGAMASAAEHRGGPIRGSRISSPPATARTDGNQDGPTAPSNVVPLERWSVRCS